MKKNILLLAGGFAALGLALVALPGGSATPQDQNESMRLAEARAQEASDRALAQVEATIQSVESMPGQELESVTVLQDDEGPSWLGVETREVTSDNAKELKLPAERGVVIGRITPDGPAAKAGLKEKDVITEVNGQRVEGSAQFRRMIHEVPAGRTVQLTVWREARAQTLSVTLGLAEEGHRVRMNAAPGAFAFRMPDVPEIPEIPQMDWSNGIAMFPGAHPRLGIDAEDVSGQLGAYFGAPGGEGVLVRNVNAGSAAEKAGVKAGDVITSFNGEHIRSLGDLREKLAAKNDDQPAKLGVLRNKSEIVLTVELPAPKQKTLHKITHSTNI
jgi:serine protease Do